MTAHDTESLVRYDIRAVLQRDAYQFRAEPFTLKSGRTSNHYIDCRRVLLSPIRLACAAQLVCSEIYTMTKGALPRGIAGVVVGASALALEVAGLFGCEGLWVRSESKDHGTRKLVEVSAEFERVHALRDSKHADTTVVVVEDVTTTGHSALAAVDALQLYGLTVMGVVSLIDREEGASEVFAQKGIPFASVFKLSDFVEKKAPYEGEAEGGRLA